MLIPMDGRKAPGEVRQSIYPQWMNTNSGVDGVEVMGLRWHVLLLISLTAVLTVCSSTLAREGDPTEDTMFFSQFDEPTDVVYMGEWSINLDCYFSQNYSNWEVAFSSELFVGNYSGRTMEWCEGGHWLGMGISLDRNQEPGVYDIPVYLNYTADDGTLVRRVFDLQLTCIRAVQLTAFRITDSKDLYLSLELTVPCDELWVRFDTDGGLKVDPEGYKMTSVEPGTYEFSSDLIGGGMFFRDDEEEVAYHIIAEFDGRIVEYARYNIPPEEVMGGQSGGYIILAIGALLIIVLLVAITVLWKRKSRAGDNGQ